MRVPGNLNGVQLWNLGELGSNDGSFRNQHGRGQWKQHLTPEQQAQIAQHRETKRAERRAKRQAMTPEERQAWKGGRSERRDARQTRRQERKATRQARLETLAPEQLAKRQARHAAKTPEQQQARADQKFQKWQTRHGYSGWLGGLAGWFGF